MRQFSIPFMAALVIAALFLGNCFTCPQLLLAFGAHGCCHHSKPIKAECQSQGLKNFVKADSGTHVPSLAVGGPLSLDAAAEPARDPAMAPAAAPTASAA